MNRQQQVTRTGRQVRTWQKALALIAALGMAQLANAATLTWDANGTFGDGNQDGSGTWSTSNANWNDGSSDVVWPNSGTNDDAAVFGVGSGAAGTVSASGTVNVNSIAFNAPGSGNYIIGGTTVTLNGTTPTITANVNATISAPLAGSAGLTKSGVGTLLLSSTTSSFTGGVTINGGVLSTSANTNIPTANSITLAGGGIWQSTVNVNAYGNALIVAAGQSGTFDNNSGNVRIKADFSGIAGSLTFDDTGVISGQGLILDGTNYNAAQAGSVITFKNAGSTNVNPRLGSTSAYGAFANSKVAFTRTGSGTLTLLMGLANAGTAEFGALDGGDSSTSISGEGFGSNNIAIQINGTVDGAFAGVISSTKITTLTKNGNSTQTLSGANAYTGGTTGLSLWS